MSDIQEILDQFNSEKRGQLSARRHNAIESFRRTGFPGAKNEEWKYTNVGRLLTATPNFHANNIQATLNDQIVSGFRIAGKNALVLVFENGIFRADLSDEIPSGAGITIGNLASMMNIDDVQQKIGTLAPEGNEAFVALNTAFMNDGIFVKIHQGIHFEKEIHFLHISTGSDQRSVSTVRNLLIAEKNSRVSFTESYHALNENVNGFTNCVSEIMVKEQAQVIMYKAQLGTSKLSHIDFTQVMQERDSLFDIVTVTLGGDLVRNNLHIRLDGVNCTAHLFGLYILDGNQLTDNHTLVDHARPHCLSNELYKGIIGGNASGVFNGKIFVRKDAQKTNAYQSNKNILLSDNAQMNTKPQLEIFADDVKCTHGATTGQLDEDALFYLRARGIGESNARALLNIAFAGDVLANIKNETLKENLMQLATRKLNNNES